MTEEQSPPPDAPVESPPANESENVAPSPVLLSHASFHWRRWVVALLPHLLTAATSVALTLAIVQTLPQPGPAISPVVRPTAAPTVTSAALPTAAPTSNVLQPQPDERVLSQEILDLQVRINELWSSLYIARAAGQIADAETALETNDTTAVERVLVAVDASLALAYERSGDLNKGPISEFRTQISQIRDDLYVRPEGLDQNLRVLRQRMLSLVEEP